MKRLVNRACIGVILCWQLSAGAEADPAAFRVPSRKGYELKKKRRCAEAIGRLKEAASLDRTPRALMNLAECEQMIGQHVQAQVHLVEAHDLSDGRGETALRKLASERLVALDKRMPRLTIRLARDIPDGTSVFRDGVELGSISLGHPLPLDPGKHTVVARGGGLERAYEIDIGVAELKELEVTPVGGKKDTGEPAASASDPAVARVHGRKGYELKKQGRCTDAIPHFEEAARLDRTPRTLMNLAECAEKIGRLVHARSHLVEAHDLSDSPREAKLRKLASERLEALDKRVPKLTLQLGRDAPPGTAVHKDGVELGPGILGAPLLIDPGNHTLIARGGGLERAYAITVAEAERKELEVTPLGGQPIDALPAPEPKGASAAAEPSPRGAAEPLASPDRMRPETDDALRTAVLISEGTLAAAGLAVGILYGINAGSLQDDIDKLRGRLTQGGSPSPCYSQPALEDCATLSSKLEQRNSARTASMAGWIGAGVGAAALAATWLVWKPREETKVSVRPLVDLTHGGVSLEWRF